MGSFVSVDDFASDLISVYSLESLLSLKEDFFVIHCTDVGMPSDTSKFYAYDPKQYGHLFIKGRELVIASCMKRVIGLIDIDSHNYHLDIDSYMVQRKAPGVNLSAVIPMHHLTSGYVCYVLAESATGKAIREAFR